MHNNENLSVDFSLLESQLRNVTVEEVRKCLEAMKHQVINMTDNQDFVVIDHNLNVAIHSIINREAGNFIICPTMIASLKSSFIKRKSTVRKFKP